MARDQQGTSDASGTPGIRIPGPLLVVDDDPAIRRMLTTFFTSRGARVLSADSGEAALKQLAQGPAAVLLDVKMPGMDGLATLRAMKATHPKLPVVMVSGVDDEETVNEALRVGAYDYVTKPFSLEYLETVVLTKILVGVEG